MKELHCDDVLVVLNVTPNLEETVVDWLLAREGGVGFTSFPVFGHSTSHADLSPAEQVSGRQRRHQFQVQVGRDAVNSFLDDARTAFATAGVRYWVLPLFAVGHLNSNS